jgi:NAD(P)-dependent dehydrogenase (short-subunit alcohol dehydrogenase family)
MSPSVNETTVQAGMDLAPKVALATGVGRGLGEIHARLLVHPDGQVCRAIADRLRSVDARRN